MPLGKVHTFLFGIRTGAGPMVVETISYCGSEVTLRSQIVFLMVLLCLCSVWPGMSCIQWHLWEGSYCVTSRILGASLMGTLVLENIGAGVGASVAAGADEVAVPIMLDRSVVKDVIIVWKLWSCYARTADRLADDMDEPVPLVGVVLPERVSGILS